MLGLGGDAGSAHSDESLLGLGGGAGSAHSESLFGLIVGGDSSHCDVESLSMSLLGVGGGAGSAHSSDVSFISESGVWVGVGVGVVADLASAVSVAISAMASWKKLLRSGDCVGGISMGRKGWVGGIG